MQKFLEKARTGALQKEREERVLKHEEKRNLLVGLGLSRLNVVSSGLKDSDHFNFFGHKDTSKALRVEAYKTKPYVDRQLDFRLGFLKLDTIRKTREQISLLGFPMTSRLKLHHAKEFTDEEWQSHPFYVVDFSEKDLGELMKMYEVLQQYYRAWLPQLKASIEEKMGPKQCVKISRNTSISSHYFTSHPDRQKLAPGFQLTISSCKREAYLVEAFNRFMNGKADHLNSYKYRSEALFKFSPDGIQFLLKMLDEIIAEMNRCVQNH